MHIVTSLSWKPAPKSSSHSRRKELGSTPEGRHIKEFVHIFLNHQSYQELKKKKMSVKIKSRKQFRMYIRNTKRQKLERQELCRDPLERSYIALFDERSTEEMEERELEKW